MNDATTAFGYYIFSRVYLSIYLHFIYNESHPLYNVLHVTAGYNVHVQITQSAQQSTWYGLIWIDYCIDFYTR